MAYSSTALLLCIQKLQKSNDRLQKSKPTEKHKKCGKGFDELFNAEVEKLREL